MEYFEVLFEQLAEKLKSNVPQDEKKDLDIKKWIWAGDINLEPEVVEVMASKNATENCGCQTPADWMVNKKTESQAYLDYKGNQSKSGHRVPSAQHQQAKSQAKAHRQFGMQTGDELLEAYVRTKQENIGATTRL